MKESILAILQLLGIRFNNKPVADTRPRYKVVSLAYGYLYYQATILSSTPVDWSKEITWYRFTGNSFEKGRFKEVEVLHANNIVICKGYVAEPYS